MLSRRGLFGLGVGAVAASAVPASTAKAATGSHGLTSREFVVNARGTDDAAVKRLFEVMKTDLRRFEGSMARMRATTDARLEEVKRRARKR